MGGQEATTEAEFEYAARGGLEQNEYAWGNELRPNGKPVANWWQGNFPEKDAKEDGYNGRAPVMSFAPNGYGLYDVAGNVWEWTSDWYADDYYSWGRKDNPTGAATGVEKVIRGGSWLCAENYCTNYRAAGRSHSPTDSALNNLGFRLVRDEYLTGVQMLLKAVLLIILEIKTLLLRSKSESCEICTVY